jgi:hypothetical protein
LRTFYLLEQNVHELYKYFMIARCSSLVEYPPTTCIVITSTGATTSFLAATTSIFQNNWKRIIAYSTCNQLSYMIFACGISNFSVSVFLSKNYTFLKEVHFRRFILFRYWFTCWWTIGRYLYHRSLKIEVCFNSDESLSPTHLNFYFIFCINHLYFRLRGSQ